VPLPHEKNSMPMNNMQNNCFIAYIISFFKKMSPVNHFP